MKIELKVTAGPHVGKCFAFDDHDSFIVGRASTVQFRLPQDDPYFSRNHFLVELNPPLCRILDLKSRNGTYVNGERVTSHDLQNGDVIRGGKTEITVQILSDVPAASEPQSVVGDRTIVPRDWDQRRKQAAPAADTVIPPTPPSPSRPEKAVERFPGYDQIELIGQGGMGYVYRARQVSSGDTVAIKLINSASAVDENDVARFLREAQIHRELAHPGIIPFRELKEANQQLFIVMDFIAGKDLQQLVKDQVQPFPIGRAVRIFCQVLEALDYAHQRGYVHRDVKPSNVILEHGPADRAWLADFGLARAYQSSRMSGLTMTDEFGGTPSFMPPEQITNFRAVSPSADQYSAAATLYYLLAGSPPYDLPRHDVAQQLLMILQDPHVPLLNRRGEVPKGLAAAVERALSRHPERRYSSCGEFRKELRAFEQV